MALGIGNGGRGFFHCAAGFGGRFNASQLDLFQRADPPPNWQAHQAGTRNLGAPHRLALGRMRRECEAQSPALGFVVMGSPQGDDMAEINIDLMALEHVCYAINKRDRANRDHVLTFAHYMGAEPIKPAVVTIDAPKAKPALAGLGIVASERVRGVGFCDV